MMPAAFYRPECAFLASRRTSKASRFIRILKLQKALFIGFSNVFGNEYPLKIDGWKMYCIFRIEIVPFFLEHVSFREGKLW